MKLPTILRKQKKSKERKGPVVMETKKLKISPPWITFYRELEAMFAGDPDINIIYSEEEYTVRLYVNGAEKADALSQLLPAERAFGNITFHIKVIPANLEVKPSKIDLFRKAFLGNSAFVDIVSPTGPFSVPINYVLFRKKVVQFFNDDLQDFNGLESTLYECIAEDIFPEHNGIAFCTDTEDPVVTQRFGKPLGEWP